MSEVTPSASLSPTSLHPLSPSPSLDATPGPAEAATTAGEDTDDEREEYEYGKHIAFDFISLYRKRNATCDKVYEAKRKAENKRGHPMNLAKYQRALLDPAVFYELHQKLQQLELEAYRKQFEDVSGAPKRTHILPPSQAFLASKFNPEHLAVLQTLPTCTPYLFPPPPSSGIHISTSLSTGVSPSSTATTHHVPSSPESSPSDRDVEPAAKRRRRRNGQDLPFDHTEELDLAVKSKFLASFPGVIDALLRSFLAAQPDVKPHQQGQILEPLSVPEKSGDYKQLTSSTTTTTTTKATREDAGSSAGKGSWSWCFSERALRVAKEYGCLKAAEEMEERMCGSFQVSKKNGEGDSEDGKVESGGAGGATKRKRYRNDHVWRVWVPQDTWNLYQLCKAVFAPMDVTSPQFVDLLLAFVGIGGVAERWKLERGLEHNSENFGIGRWDMSLVVKKRWKLTELRRGDEVRSILSSVEVRESGGAGSQNAKKVKPENEAEQSAQQRKKGEETGTLRWKSVHFASPATPMSPNPMKRSPAPPSRPIASPQRKGLTLPAISTLLPPRAPPTHSPQLASDTRDHMSSPSTHSQPSPNTFHASSPIASPRPTFYAPPPASPQVHGQGQPVFYYQVAQPQQQQQPPPTTLNPAYLSPLRSPVLAGPKSVHAPPNKGVRNLQIPLEGYIHTCSTHRQQQPPLVPTPPLPPYIPAPNVLSKDIFTHHSLHNHLHPCTHSHSLTYAPPPFHLRSPVPSPASPTPSLTLQPPGPPTPTFATQSRTGYFPPQPSPSFDPSVSPRTNSNSPVFIASREESWTKNESVGRSYQAPEPNLHSEQGGRQQVQNSGGRTQEFKYVSVFAQLK
ncbi:hypothetical protein HDV05_007222 [Chytridiales sp. JEL 0842]|nr:hypothetical protein HDV05_007222 [Chytridiales sp. JEL 0842]